MKKLESYFNSGKMSLNTYEELKKLDEENLKKALIKLRVIKSKKWIGGVIVILSVTFIVFLLMVYTLLSNYISYQNYCKLSENYMSTCDSKIISKKDIYEIKNELQAATSEISDILTQEQWYEKKDYIKNEYFELGYSIDDYNKIEKDLDTGDFKKLVLDLEIYLEEKINELEKEKEKIINEISEYNYEYSLKEEKLLLQVNELNEHLKLAKIKKEEEGKLAKIEADKKEEERLAQIKSDNMLQEEQGVQQEQEESEKQQIETPAVAPSYCYLTFDDANVAGMDIFINSSSISKFNIGKFEVIEEESVFCPYFYSPSDIYTIEDLS